MANSGIVYLVGAGPGDLGLVTFRAHELISAAEVLVYDYLVHPDIVDWCPKDCEIIYVGKKAGFHSVPQEEIEALLVNRAKLGKRVVRLKGGDPYVFGRGGEEAKALAAGKVPFEVVPGVTASLAAGAYAGIPLTQRNTSSSLVLVTGHEDPAKHELQVDWVKLGGLTNTTLAIYMGMGRMKDIMVELQKGGMAPDTPAAVVQWASLGRQRSLASTVSKLASATAKAGLKAPAVIIVGEVVKYQKTVDWFEHLSLFGRRIAITRSREGNKSLRNRLEELGAEVLELPLIRVVPDVDRDTLVDIIAELGSYDWMIFTSASGVRIFFEHFLKAYDDVRALGLLRFAAVGESTKREIEKFFVRVECAPKVATAEALADAMIATDSLDSAKVVVVTGNLNRNTLVSKLEEEGGAIVDLLQLYRTEKLNLSDSPAALDFQENGADAVLFSSSSAVEAYGAQHAALALGPGAKKPLMGSIGPQTSASLVALELGVDFEAAKPGLDSLVIALVKQLKKRK
jgi:uroporphyrinogen III methyltransferase/synthase